MALFINSEAAVSSNRSPIASTLEERTQPTFDEEFGKYLHCSRGRRQPHPLIRRFSKQGGHRSSFCREGSASKELRETQWSWIKPDWRSWSEKWRQARSPIKLWLDWDWSNMLFQFIFCLWLYGFFCLCLVKTRNLQRERLALYYWAIVVVGSENVVVRPLAAV